MYAESEISQSFSIYSRVGHSRICPTESKRTIGDLVKFCCVLVVEVDQNEDADPSVLFSHLVILLRSSYACIVVVVLTDISSSTF